MSVAYPLTLRAWPGDGQIFVIDEYNVRIAAFSIEFLRRGGVYSWTYVKEALACCVLQPGPLYAIGAEEETPVNEEADPDPGLYRMRGVGKLESGRCQTHSTQADPLLHRFRSNHKF